MTRNMPFRLYALLTAIGVYAVFGSPTPDRMGMAEIVTGFFLVISVGFEGAARACAFNPQGPSWFRHGQILMAYGFTVPVICALVYGNDLALVMRDLAAFMFLLLPVFLWPGVVGEGRFNERVRVALIVLGIIFALRAIADTALQAAGQTGQLYYFANAPCVLYAALSLIFAGGALILRAKHPGIILKGIAILAVSAIPILAMGLAVQRATLGYLIFCIAVFLIFAFLKKPRPVSVFVMVVLLAGWMAAPYISGLADMFINKTLVHGANRRLEEIWAVWEQVSQSWTTTVFGMGWGGSFESPAVAEVRVNYAHSLPAAMVLKGGIAGLLLAGIYLFSLLKIMIQNIRVSGNEILSLFGPFIIATCLYASHKSLDYGLFLALIASMDNSVTPVERKPFLR